MTTIIDKEKILSDLKEGKRLVSDLSYSESNALLKEKRFSANGSRMLIYSGHKTFDRQTNLITTGNIWANTIHGGFIRSYHETECNGFTREKGHLQEFDLKPFKNLSGSKEVIDFIKKSDFKESVILYAIFSFNGDKRVIHGYILTDYYHQHIQTFHFPKTYKSFDILHAVEPYISFKI